MDKFSVSRCLRFSLCVVFLLLVLVLIVVSSTESNTSQEKTQNEGNEYEYTVTPFYELIIDHNESDSLFYVTADMPDVYYDALCDWVEASYGEKVEISNPHSYFLPPMAVVCLQTSEDYIKSSVGKAYYIPQIYNGRIWRFYIVNQTEDGRIVVSNWSGFAEEISKLSSMTSKEAPLIFVNDYVNSYAVIGDEAIWLDCDLIPMPNTISEIFWGELDPYTTQILLSS